jgi:thioredoxin-like negative regulator of GroEL
MTSGRSNSSRRSTMRAILLVVLLSTAWVLSAQSPAAPRTDSNPAPTVDPATDNPGLVRLWQWLREVDMHSAGYADVPATLIAQWSRRDLDTLTSDLRRLSALLQRPPNGRDRGPAAIQLYNRRFSREVIESVFHGNATLLRGAVLHADIAVFVADDFSRLTDPEGTFVVEDGRRRGVGHRTAHWQIGRQLLDALVPGPGGNEQALLWYRAVSAHLLREGNLSEALPHLERARQIYPDSPFAMLDSAYLYEVMSSPGIQAAAQELVAGGARVATDSRRTELERAERFFRADLALAADDIEARVRLGHTLGELGRHAEAAGELQRAIDERPTGEQLYFAQLFLGREQQALGSRQDARRWYENAAELYPTAQSPQLALGHLTRESGDRTGALEALRGVSRSHLDRTDPWWAYYEPHLDDADALMDKMRGLGSADR